MPEWYSTFAEAVGSGEPPYLACEDCGEPSLPPRRICPACGGTSLTERPLSSTGTVVSFTEIAVTIPAFHGTTPYTVVIAEFPEGVRLTGQLRGDAPVAIGDAVSLGTEALEDGSAILTLTPESTDG